MSCSVYDTAWVACVTKTIEGSARYLFSACFTYLFNTQSSTGSWKPPATKNPDQCTTDEVVATLGALYALTQLDRNPLQLAHWTREFGGRQRIDHATSALAESLRSWDIESSQQVGSEVLVPALLDLPERDSTRPCRFDFSGRSALYQLRDAKLSRIPPQALYHGPPASLLHSLEAFYGDTRFSYDHVKQHRIKGSLMGSPSATAAYLMATGSWDDDSEAYLRLVIEAGAGRGHGGVPSAFPSTYFELTWVRAVSSVRWTSC